MESKTNCLAQNLVYLRKKINKSQNELAKSLELNRGNIASYENGNAEPSAVNLLRIVKYFNIKLEYLLEHDLSAEDERVSVGSIEIESSSLDSDEEVKTCVQQAGEFLKVVKAQVIYVEYLLDKSSEASQELLLSSQIIFDLAEMTNKMAADTIMMGKKLLNS